MVIGKRLWNSVKTIPTDRVVRVKSVSGKIGLAKTKSWGTPQQDNTGTWRLSVKRTEKPWTSIVAVGWQEI